MNTVVFRRLRTSDLATVSSDPPGLRQQQWGAGEPCGSSTVCRRAEAGSGAGSKGEDSPMRLQVLGDEGQARY